MPLAVMSEGAASFLGGLARGANNVIDFLHLPTPNGKFKEPKHDVVEVYFEC